MDPIGADQRGNPIGSLAYTNQFTANSFDGYQQVRLNTLRYTGPSPGPGHLLA
jgi:hypothetical protein